MGQTRCCVVGLLLFALMVSLLITRSSADTKEERELSDKERVAIGSILSGQRRPWRYGRRSWNPRPDQENSLYNAKVADLLRQQATEQNEYDNYIKSLISNNIPLKPIEWDEE